MSAEASNPMSSRRKFKPVLETKKGIDLAPMVDVVFLLLAYFLINSTLAKTPAIRVDLPKSQTSSYVSEEAVDILVRENGEIVVNGTKVSEKELGRALEGAGLTPDAARGTVDLLAELKSIGRSLGEGKPQRTTESGLKRLHERAMKHLDEIERIGGRG